MRIHRAFAKSMERSPAWSNCCEAAKESHQKMIDQGEMLLDMEHVRNDWTVCVCGNRVKQPYVRDIKDGCFTYLEDCDIDEVALTAEEVEALDVVRL